GPFLHSALAALSPDDLVALFNAAGVPTKTEPGGKVFPESDRALDVLRALEHMLTDSGAELRLGQPVVGVDRRDDEFEIETPNGVIRTGKIVLTTGGQSYPGCGTTGDGYGWAKLLGHKI